MRSRSHADSPRTHSRALLHACVLLAVVAALGCGARSRSGSTSPSAVLLRLRPHVGERYRSVMSSRSSCSHGETTATNTTDMRVERIEPSSGDVTLVSTTTTLIDVGPDGGGRQESATESIVTLDARHRPLSRSSTEDGFSFRVVDGAELPEGPVDIGDAWDEVDEMTQPDGVVRMHIHRVLIAFEGTADDRIAVVESTVRLEPSASDAAPTRDIVRIAARDAFLVESHSTLVSRGCTTTTDISVRAID